MMLRAAAGLLAVAVVVVALAAAASEVRARRQNLAQARAHFERGLELYQQSAFPAARVEFRHALRADPGDWKPPFYVGVVEVHMQRYDAALLYLERALSLNPTEPKVARALGVAYFKLGRLDLAKGYFAASLEMDPSSADGRALLETMVRLERRAEMAAVAAD